MNNKNVIIFGITGQDGSYMARSLLKKKYRIFGISTGNNSFENINRLKINNKVKIYKFKNLTEKKLIKLFQKIKPRYVYFLSGQSSVAKSFVEPNTTYLSNNYHLFLTLEYARKYDKNIKILNSGSSECFGNNRKVFCNENTEFNPVSPYGRAKALSIWLCKYYRENYQVQISNAILFNHESPLRKKDFVTKKIIDFVKNYSKNKCKILKLGNVMIKRDWSWAPEIIEAIIKINTSKKCDDYVVGSGKLHSLKDFIYYAFKEKNISKKAFCVEKNLIRKNEILSIASNPKKIWNKLKFKTKVSFAGIVNKMLNDELI